ncbi:flagellar basal body rod protein FlgC [Tumebacillus permanentifrigoris]|jgi:flagellar basal-body rod protein FlgC|uniref:Flagellar basal-body rod protein FlgC n=1 Tax=Tumebacillus permanentifrigoris TaxID=378543 RepID=A0A316D817_9BACL|nr:flagellar basal body rod protein FlgC [Tumebacillus permanentifrigoris]PWK12717.1 flagellar basal-body rod protein FlgC [Tumebacillus permanentifrigoris]
MGMFDSINISASGLTAQRLRLDVVSSNISNANTTRGVDGQPYRRQLVTFGERVAPSFQDALNDQLQQAPSQGVRVTQITRDEAPFKLMYDPSHPDAEKNPSSPMYGYVQMPNVDISTEMVDMISASRSYEANITAINSAKSMAMKALEIGR